MRTALMYIAFAIYNLGNYFEELHPNEFLILGYIWILFLSMDIMDFIKHHFMTKKKE